jgi:hypothetical protein
MVLVEEPRARCAGRPPRWEIELMPSASETGSRTASARGPTQSEACSVSPAIAAARAKASKLAIWPIQISPKPDRSALIATASD